MGESASMKVIKITVGRLYNLGNYEHIRYDITVEIQPGESPATAMTGIEKIMAGLAPEKTWGVHSDGDLERTSHHLKEMAANLTTMDEAAFRARYGYFVGTPTEYHTRCMEGHTAEVVKRAKAVQRAATARKLLEDIGGASNWKDAKLDWADDNQEDDL
jgi:hypothetical protein